MTTRREEKGAAAVELALVLPLLLMIVGCVVDLTLALLVRAEMEEAAEEAAVHAARYPNAAGRLAAQNRAADATTFADIAAGDVVISACSGAGVDREFTVTIAYTHELLLAGIVPSIDGEIDINAVVSSDVLSDDGCP